MTDVFTIRAQFQALQAALDHFRYVWLAEAVTAQVFELPTNSSGLAPATIAAHPLTGHAALKAAESAFSRLHLLADQHPKTVFRLPGWIGVKRDLSPEITAINTLKDELAASFLTLEPTPRRVMARQALPQVALKQCYRHLVQWNPAPQRIYFSWAGVTPSSVRISRQDFLAQLDAAEENRPPRFTMEDWQALIASNRQKLAQVPVDLPLVIRWRKAPHPRVMAYDSGQISNAGRIVPANLPVFVVVEDGKWPTSTPLEDFDLSSHIKEQPRSDAALLATVIERLHLYAKVK